MNQKLFKSLGWKKSFQKYIKSNDLETSSVGRISAHFGQSYEIITPEKKLEGILPGSVLYENNREKFPVVGDMVIIEILEGENKALIKEVIPRASFLSRKKPGTMSDEQLICANIDIIFLVQGLDHDFNVRRLERYLLMATEMNIEPIIVLNKTDICEDLEEKINQVRTIAETIPIITISAHNEDTMEMFTHYLTTGVTGAFLGSSGVGKSTIINKLLGVEIQKTRAVREDDSKGRHATTVRQLFQLSSGGMVIDTPGMRELEPWQAEESLGELFHDIEVLAENCKFNDCTHHHEPGCQVQQAIAEGLLAAERLKSYNKLLREQQYQLSLVDEKAALEKRRQDKEFGKMVKRIIQEKQLK